MAGQIRDLWLHRAAPFVAMAVGAILVAGVIFRVDLDPRVEADFFFAPDDPQVAAETALRERYPSGEAVIVRVESSDVESAGYVSRIGAFGEELATVPGVTNVFSVASENVASPLWSRILLDPDGGATNVVLIVEIESDREFVDALERVVAAYAGPSFEPIASGVPVIIELIRRSLRHDLVVFSSTAILLFGLIIGLIYRSFWVVAGTLVSCVAACGATLLLLQFAGIRVGLLTANIVTIVFVLTLSHTVFLVSNWRQRHARGEKGSVAARAGVRRTIQPSLWCMITTVLGFLSLWLAPAKPLRELGTAGALGTVVALVVAYTLLPGFLVPARMRAVPANGFPQNPPRLRKSLLAVAALFTVAVGFGVLNLNTDPSLLSYFAPDSQIRSSLENIDRRGGSSPLLIAVRSADGETLASREGYDRMWAFQDSLEADAATGVVLSPAPLLADARSRPLVGLLPIPALIAILDRPEFGGLLDGYLTDERDEALFSIRMIESGRVAPRDSIRDRLVQHATPAGLTATSVAGLYDLQGRLGELIQSSLKIGLGGLMILFFGIALVVSRSAPTAIWMLCCLVAIPALVLGTFGHLDVAVDIITSPAANVALAMGVDSIIHLVNRVRTLSGGPAVYGGPWAEAQRQLAAPILGASAVICVGFGIFSLSDFPPTQRFGFAVILGTMTAAAVATIVLPSLRRGEPAGQVSD